MKGNISWADERRADQKWLRSEKTWSVLTISMIPIVFAILYLEMRYHFISDFMGRFLS